MYSINIKTEIVKLHNDGQSFNDIAKYLNSKYNIKTSRQSVCSQYHRIINDPFFNSDENIEKTQMIHDIINYSIRGLSAKDISNITSIKVKYINEVIGSSTSKLIYEHNKLVESIKNALINNSNIDEIMQYKGEAIRDKYILVEAVQLCIEESINSRLKEMYKSIKDINVIKDAATKYNIGINTAYIKNEGEQC